MDTWHQDNPACSFLWSKNWICMYYLEGSRSVFKWLQLNYFLPVWNTGILISIWSKRAQYLRPYIFIPSENITKQYSVSCRVVCLDNVTHFMIWQVYWRTVSYTWCGISWRVEDRVAKRMGPLGKSKVICGEVRPLQNIVSLPWFEGETFRLNCFCTLRLLNLSL
jgi:hypothetical protein